MHEEECGHGGYFKNILTCHIGMNIIARSVLALRICQYFLTKKM